VGVEFSFKKKKKGKKTLILRGSILVDFELGLKEMCRLVISPVLLFQRICV